MTDFSKATERPWSFEEIAPYDDGLGYIRGKNENDIIHAGDSSLSADENRANAALIVAAVNAFDPEREKKVEALVEAVDYVLGRDVLGCMTEDEVIEDFGSLGLARVNNLRDRLHSLKGGENG